MLDITAFNIPAKALYDFAGATEDELNISAGEELFICEKIDADWVRGVINGRVGLVPAAYIEEESQ